MRGGLRAVITTVPLTDREDSEFLGIIIGVWMEQFKRYANHWLWGGVQVVAGSRTEVEVLQSFLAGFDGSLGPKSGIVTQEKFLAYYSAVSASVDDDDYFELILRNTWHLPGAGDTTCRRLLVTKEDGTQSIEEIEDDIDITKEDLQVRSPAYRRSGGAGGAGCRA